MSNTEGITVRIDKETKTEAERVLNLMGISMSEAVRIYLKQIIYRNKIPFEISVGKDQAKTAEKKKVAEDLYTPEDEAEWQRFQDYLKTSCNDIGESTS